MKGLVMGSRGAFSKSFGRTGGVPFENRQYSLVGWLGKIKVIQCDAVSNNPTPTYSNTANTTYYSYNKTTKAIEHIYYYKNHKLVKSIDLNAGVKPHAHFWSTTVVGRKPHDAKNVHALSPKDVRLLAVAITFNQTQK